MDIHPWYEVSNKENKDLGVVPDHGIVKYIGKTGIAGKLWRVFWREKYLGQTV